MKINKIYMWALAVGALALGSCSDKEDGPGGGDGNPADGVEIGIRTEVRMNTKSALIQDFDNGQEMNVWISVASDLGAIVLEEQLKATNNGGGNWKLDKSVRLGSGQTAEVMAFYPYAEGATDYKAVPIDVTRQTDVLYSGGSNYASSTSNVATLNMKHALSILSVNVKKDGYSGNGVVSKMTVESADLLATKGTLNVSSGRITPTEYGSLTVEANSTIGANGISGGLPGLWVVPFSSKDHNEAMMITLTIDGKDYKVELPEVSMNIGWQYIFHAVLTANGLVFVPDATEEYALNKADDEVGNLVGHGVVTFGFDGSTFVFPAFTGDNVYGIIRAADGTTANYKIGGSLNVAGGKQEIAVETWNSTGFEISHTEGIESIDLSAY